MSKTKHKRKQDECEIYECTDYIQYDVYFYYPNPHPLNPDQRGYYCKSVCGTHTKRMPMPGWEVEAIYRNQL